MAIILTQLGNMLSDVSTDKYHEYIDFRQKDEHQINGSSNRMDRLVKVDHQINRLTSYIQSDEQLEIR